MRSTSKRSSSVNTRALFLSRDALFEAFRNSFATAFFCALSSACSFFKRRIAVPSPSVQQAAVLSSTAAAGPAAAAAPSEEAVEAAEELLPSLPDAEDMPPRRREQREPMKQLPWTCSGSLLCALCV